MAIWLSKSFFDIIFNCTIKYNLIVFHILFNTNVTRGFVMNMYTAF